MSAITTGLTTSYRTGGTWRSFSHVIGSTMDSIKIQTTGLPFYLQYRTHNQGKTSFYPYVKSTVNDYAGASGRPIQKIQIKAYDHSHNNLHTGVVVMYRARVNGTWLSWVSNADPDWMTFVQQKYNLGGALDTSAYYAGISGQNIDGLQILVYQVSSIDSGSTTEPTVPIGNGEITPTMSYLSSTSSWVAFSQQAITSRMDAIRIQTPTNKSYRLMYKTLNQGQTAYYPAVSSKSRLTADYAGSAGKPMQRLSIQVYSDADVKLTSGVIVMYRAKTASTWLPWVSNADPEWMYHAKNKLNIPSSDSLDTSASYAGVDGQNITGIEIRIYETTATVPEAPPSLPTGHMEYAKNSSSTWLKSTNGIIASGADCIRIHTEQDEPYYLSYCTWNEGQSNYYPLVSSKNTNDYAGVHGKPIQRLRIYAYSNSGTKLTTGVVVMYRAFVEGVWLPWVSNADPDWMYSAQSQNNLYGALDTSASYAGKAGKNIEKFEVRIFNMSTLLPVQPLQPVGDHKIINVPFKSQKPHFPTGCESVSAAMLLAYYGIYDLASVNSQGESLAIADFVDNHLTKSAGVPFDPNNSFGGNPRSTSAYGCYAPVIKDAINSVLVSKNFSNQYVADDVYALSLTELCNNYIDKDMPVVLWATMEMRSSYNGNSWMYNEQLIQWIAPEHCLVLVGYDEQHYIFNDPLQNNALTYYTKDSVERAYAAFSKQAVVIRQNSDYVPAAVTYEITNWANEVLQRVRAMDDVYDVASYIPGISANMDVTLGYQIAPPVCIKYKLSTGYEVSPEDTIFVGSVTDGGIDSFTFRPQDNESFNDLLNNLENVDTDEAKFIRLLSADFNNSGMALAAEFAQLMDNGSISMSSKLVLTPPEIGVDVTMSMTQVFNYNGFSYSQTFSLVMEVRLLTPSYLHQASYTLGEYAFRHMEAVATEVVQGIALELVDFFESIKDNVQVIKIVFMMIIKTVLVTLIGALAIAALSALIYGIAIFLGKAIFVVATFSGAAIIGMLLVSLSDKSVLDVIPNDTHLLTE